MKKAHHPFRAVWPAFCLAALLLSGCSGMPSMSSMNPLNLVSGSSQRTCQEKVGIKGRFSIRYQANGREESLHGGFEWQQQPDYTVINLLSPLGQTMARIEVTPEMTTFLAPKRAPKSAKNAEELLSSELGWALPVTGLKQWIQGCATDMQGTPFVATPDNTLVITRDGWQLEYLSWIDGPKTSLPKRINLQKGSRNYTDIDLNLKLVIDEWNF